MPRVTWALCGLTAAGALLIAGMGSPGAAMSAAIMVALVAVVGLPHGAYDVEIARRLLRPSLGRSWAPLFVASYIALGAAALGFWIAAPWAGLITLLILGALHWGADDLEIRTRSRWLDRALILSRGLVPVALPLAFHPTATATIFGSLLGGVVVSPQVVLTAGVLAAALAAPGLVAAVVLEQRQNADAWARGLAELVVLIAWFAVVPPILAFACYFCLWHAVRHSLRSMARSDGSSIGSAGRAYLGRVIGPTLATWLLAVIAIRILTPSTAWVEVSWRIVFVGLFALTVPHVALELLAERSNVAAVFRRSRGRGQRLEAAA
jgi:Brp/Blh family beta-carotene 15,15'-monooxygenase